MTPTLDEENFRKGIELERIFMPYASERRKNFLEAGGRFIHYTSAANAIRIIRSQTFWVRNARCMNDYMEVYHGHSHLMRFFRDEDKERGFREAIDPFGPGLAKEVLDFFNQWWRGIPFNTYLGCISEHDDDEDNHGRLSMWRAYGQAKERAALVLKIPSDPRAVQGLNLFLSPVAYFNYDRVAAELSGVIGNIKQNAHFLSTVEREDIHNIVFHMLLLGAVCLKHEGFKEEREWRVIYVPEIHDSEHIKQDVEIIDGAPQSVYKISLVDNAAEEIVGVGIPSLIDRVIVGPSNYPEPVRAAFIAELRKAGMQDAESRVVVSGIPLRT